MTVSFGHSPKTIAQYFLWKAKEDNNPLTPMQVLKLVYLAHGWTLGLLGRPLINEPVEAWRYGPVVPSVYRSYKSFGSEAISQCPDAAIVLPGDEDGIASQVWKLYGNMSGVRLSALTHQPGTPWEITYRESPGAVISNDLIEDHYKRLYEKRKPK